MTTTLNTIAIALHELKEELYTLNNSIEDAEALIGLTYAEVKVHEHSNCSDAEMERIYNKHEDAVENYNEMCEEAEALKLAIEKITDAYFIIRGI